MSYEVTAKSAITMLFQNCHAANLAYAVAHIHETRGSDDSSSNNDHVVACSRVIIVQFFVQRNALLVDKDLCPNFVANMALGGVPNPPYCPRHRLPRLSSNYS